MGESERADKKEARTIAIGLGVLAVLLVVAGAFALPFVAEFNRVYLAPGLGIKDAALLAFIATVIVLVVFAVAAGDGLLGELQFMLAGFFSFFLVLWLLLAWIF